MHGARPHARMPPLTLTLTPPPARPRLPQPSAGPRRLRCTSTTAAPAGATAARSRGRAGRTSCWCAATTTAAPRSSRGMLLGVWLGYPDEIELCEQLGGCAGGTTGTAAARGRSGQLAGCRA
jgi:hypothetical protein